MIGKRREPTYQDVTERICRAVGWDMRKKLLAVKAGGMDNGYETMASGYVKRGSANIGSVTSVHTGGIKNKYNRYTAEQQKTFKAYVDDGQFIADIRAIADEIIDKYFLPNTPYLLRFKESHVEYGCFEIVCDLRISASAFHPTPEPPKVEKLDRKAYEQVLLTAWAKASCEGGKLPDSVTRLVDVAYKKYLKEE